MPYFAGQHLKLIRHAEKHPARVQNCRTSTG
nr:MAG TPA_asm: hypothetical protein [Caudoviricetes sp.]DAT39192.1 MAG TPA: hypothetical protein [Caudoviricetes sp.]